MTEHVDVLVVGAGPTGLTLACDLIRRGARVRIIDAAEHGFTGSRAKGLQPRTLEVFHDLGVLGDVADHGSTYPLLGIHLGPLTLPWVMHRHHKVTPDIPYPNTLLVAQADTDAALRHRLGDLGGQVEFTTRLRSYQENDGGILATVDGPDGEELIPARFLVGTDGGSSTVRKHAGIGFVGTTDESDRWIVADVAVDGLARHRWHIWPRSAGRFMALCPLPGGEKFQLMLRLRPDEDPNLERESLDQRVRQISGGAGLRVRTVSWMSVFRPNVRLVERYREGNVFLAGDAAHVHTPAGAQGLNTGVQDAYNLGWKLGQVLAGAPQALLDSYEAERRTVAARVLGLSSELYQNMASRPLAAAKRGDEERQLTLSYHGGPLAPEQSDRTDTLRVGDRAPDAGLVAADGQPVQLFDVYRGSHFTAIAYGAGAAADLDRLDWPSTGAPLRRIVVGATVTRADQVLEDSANTFRRIYGLTGDTLLLVRPDGYLGHIATHDMRAATQTAAKAMTP